MEVDAATGKETLASQSVNTGDVERYESDNEIERPGNMGLLERIE